MKEFCKREQSFSLSLYHQLVLREKRGNFFLFFIYKNHHSYLPWWRQENIFIISISTLSVSLQYTYLHHRSLRSITIFLVPLVILVCQVCPIKLLLLPHACVCLYFNNLIYNFHFSAANSIIIRPSIGDVRSWWSRRDVFVILQVEHDLPYNSNSLAIYSSLLQMMFWSFLFLLQDRSLWILWFIASRCGKQDGTLLSVEKWISLSTFWLLFCFKLYGFEWLQTPVFLYNNYELFAFLSSA